MDCIEPNLKARFVISYFDKRFHNVLSEHHLKIPFSPFRIKVNLFLLGQFYYLIFLILKDYF